jgi:hypothetical protein
MYRSTKQNKTTFLFTRSLRMLEPLLSLLCEIPQLSGALGYWEWQAEHLAIA